MINPPLYFINLDRHKDRLDYMNFMLSNSGVKYKRVAALDGQENPDYLSPFLKLEPTPDFFRIVSCNTQSLYRWGCLISHLKAIKAAYEDGCEYAFISEDHVEIDFYLKNINKFNKIISKAPKDYEVIQLYCSNSDFYQNWRKRLDKESYFTKWNRQNYGAVIYLINRYGMSKILDLSTKNGDLEFTESEYYVADFYIYNLLNTYTFLPQFFSQKTFSEATSSTSLLDKLDPICKQIKEYIEQ